MMLTRNIAADNRPFAGTMLEDLLRFAGIVVPFIPVMWLIMWNGQAIA